MTENPTGRQRPVRLARLRALPAWTLVAAGVVAGGLAGGAYGELRTPAYTATSYVVAVPTDQADPAAALGFAQAYGRVATQLAVLGDAQTEAKVPMATLRTAVRTATSPDAPMVAVSATSTRPAVAADMADAVAHSLTRHAEAAKKSTHIALVEFSRAVKPSAPATAPARVTGLVGASAGGLLAGLALLVRPRRERTEQVRAASVPGPAVAADVHGQL